MAYGIWHNPKKRKIKNMLPFFRDLIYTITKTVRLVIQQSCILQMGYIRLHLVHFTGLKKFKRQSVNLDNINLYLFLNPIIALRNFKINPILIMQVLFFRT